MSSSISNKQQAFAIFEDTRKEFLENCRWIARRLAQKRGVITIDDVRAETKLPLGIDGRVYGAVFANKDEWEKVGYTQTSIKTSHGRPVAKFALKKPRVLGQMALF